MPRRSLFWPRGKTRATGWFCEFLIIPNPPVIKSYSGPPEPGSKPYQLSGYPDAVAALKQGLG